MNLRQKTFSAVRWTTLSMLSKAGLTLLQMSVLARLLPSTDFGLMALVVAVIALAQVFSDIGISNAIIHNQNISQESLSSLYWLNIAAGISLALIIILISPILAEWYQEPKLTNILIIVSFSFPIIAIGQQLRVVAEKNLRFKKLALIEISVSLFAFTTSIYLAYEGAGVYALVSNMLANAFLSTILYWIILSDGWRPMTRLRISEVIHYVRFGGYMIGFSLTNTMLMQIDVLIGGRLLGIGSLGAYSLTKEFSLRLAMIINPIATRVGLPVMAKEQNDKHQLKSIYLKMVLMTSSINFPLYLLISIYSSEIVNIVFGAQWQESIYLLRILALWGLVRSIGNPAGSLIFAVGRVKLAFWWSLAMIFIFVPAYWVGAHFGTNGLAMSALLSATLIIIPQWLFIINPLCGASLAEYLRVLITPLSISIISIISGYIVSQQAEIEFLKLFIGCFITALIYILLSLRLNKQWSASIYELIFKKQISIKLQ